MPYRVYTVNQKYVKNKHGDIGFYKKKIKKWIGSNKPYKSQKRGLVKLSIHSKRFGFIDLYNRKEQQSLICPSGYSISQCFNVLRKMWYGYHKARYDEKNYERMVKYAKAIQDVQNDMGIEIASFPNLGLHGDVLILNNKEGERIVSEDHSEMNKKQEEYERKMAENSKKIQEKLQKHDVQEGEEIKTFADDFGPSLIDDEEYEGAVPNLPQAEIDEEAGEEVITIPDDIPFQSVQKAKDARRIQKKLLKLDKKKGAAITTIADDVAPHKMIKAEIEDTVPELLEPKEQNDEEIVVITDDTPFQSSTVL